MLRSTEKRPYTRVARAGSLLFPTFIKGFSGIICSIIFVIAGILLSLGVADRAYASTITFEFTFSGASVPEPWTNSATATGYITVDEALWPNPNAPPNHQINTSDSIILDLSVTVEGTAGGVGDGTWGKSDFGSIIWDTGGGALDLSIGTELVGQAPQGTTGVFWGVDNCGDFNLFGTGAPRPYGVGPFGLAANYGDGEVMLLTSMRAVPEPATMLLLGTGLLGLGVFGRKKFKK